MALGDRFDDVLSAARSGAEWAWAELYAEFAPGLLRFIAGLGAAEPEDCLGECFLQIVRNLPGFVGEEASFRAWTYLLARNRVVDSWRGAGRRPLPSEEVVAVAERRRHDEAADAALTRRDAVEQILATLTPDQRAVVILRVLDQFSAEETAAILGRSPGSVRVLQHRAIKALRDAVAPVGGNRGRERLPAEGP